MDGWITVGTRLSTKQLEKDLSSAERELEKFAREKEKLTSEQKRASETLTELQKERDSYAKTEMTLEELRQKYKSLKEEKASLLRDGKFTENERPQIEAIEEEMRNVLAQQREYLNGWEKEATKIANIDDKIAKQEQLLEGVNQKIKTNEYNQGLVKNKIKETNEELTKKRGYEQVKENIDNVGNSVSSVIKKVGKWALAVFSVRSAYSLVRQAISTISQYDKKIAADIEYIRYAVAMTLKPVIEWLVNAVYKLLYYVNYIANKWFDINLFANASSKNFAKANGNAQKLKKTLAGFDELNVLNDDGSSGVLTPSFDLSGLKDIEVPKWVKWIADNKELFKIFADWILVAFGAKTAASVLSWIKNVIGVSGGSGLLGLSELLLAIAGVVLITIAIKGVKQVMSEVKALNESIDAIGVASDNNKKRIEDFGNKIHKLGEENKLTAYQVGKYTEALELNIDSSIRSIDSLEKQKNWIGSLTGTNAKLTEQQKEETKQLVYLCSEYKKLYDQGLLNEDQQKRYKEYLRKTIEKLDAQGVSTKELKKDYEKLTGQKYEATITVTAKADTSKAQKDYSNFFSKLGASASLLLSPSDWGSGFGSKLKSIWSGQKLAKGGIVNMPGKGINYGGANIAEKGPEGVIPLTNSQMMSQLGEAIGKFITINANITNTMNGRIISRELQKIQNDSDFAFNR